ncbi:MULTISPECIES: hypothetical protein [unclassified Nocardiopsis]|uniref:hypothetical protein n=1 Tax=unclassified Nocardiopsis TaxID=2649073 RepID=UPI00135C806A|nr:MULTISPECIES: hypothetical protein [unclassified Nocardiopsis]
MTMTGMRQAEVGLGLVERTPPEAILREGAPSLLGSVPEHRRKAAIELAHWSYGAVAGAAFALLPRGLRSSRLTGPVYGVLSWGAFELLLAPALGLAHARGSRPQQRMALMLDHVVFGLVVGAPPEVAVAGPGDPEDHEEGGEEGRRRGRHRT